MTDLATYGNWTDMSAIAALKHQRMELSAVQLASFWRRSSLSADFWARYTALFVPIPEPSGQLNRNEIEQVLAFLLNELFENCAKFSKGPITTIQYHAWVRENQFDFQITNHITTQDYRSFSRFIEELLAGDPEQMYFDRLEKQAETNARGSGLGYLTLIKDYGVQFGFRFRQITDTSVAVDIQAHVNRQE